MSDVAPETTGPEFGTGPVNLDSLKEILGKLSEVIPFVDEISKMAFMTQINGIHEAGNPHEEKEAAIIPAPAPVETVPGAAAQESAATTGVGVSPTAETAAATVQGENPELAERDARIAELEAQLASAHSTANPPAPPEVVETPAPAAAPEDTTHSPEAS